MSDRVSQTVLVCEDEVHERLVKAFLVRCGLASRAPYVKSLVASKMQQGGNDVWVLHRFPEEVHACRQRNAKAKTRLLVMIDSDSLTVEERRSQLSNRLTQAGLEDIGTSEPMIVLIPKRNAETWISALLGRQVDENEDCKDWDRPSREDFRRAAEALFQWSRPGATPGSTCVPSLRDALREWARIH
jgi:hypothetical protein